MLLGTDYPCDMGHYDPHGLLASFEAETRHAILGGNAVDLLALAVSSRAIPPNALADTKERRPWQTFARY